MGELERAIAYLEQQAEFLRIIQRFGLDAREIMRGISLGIGADAQELFGAAVMALSLAGG